jgi:hypothetical protein
MNIFKNNPWEKNAKLKTINLFWTFKINYNLSILSIEPTNKV